MAGFDPDVFGGTTAPAGFDPDVFAGKATPPLIVAMPKAAPAAIEAGKEINSIPRQLGLTARYGIEGLANAAQIVTEPIRYVTDRLTNQTGKTLPLGELASRGMDALGLPKPEGANERVIGDATRLVAGAGGLGAAAGAASALPGAMGRAGAFLSANMPQQLASAAGAGLAGGASREAGGSPLMQGAAALGGGVFGGMAPGAIGYGLNAGKSLVNSMRPGQQQVVQQRIDQTINVTLQNQGIDPASITPAMRSALREQVGKAMDMGDLNPEAVARLADYTRLNLTPTRSRLTLDPFDVTQEQNASSLAASLGARRNRLPQIADQNNRRLVSLIDDMGGARPVDSYGQGSAVTRTISAADEAMQRQVRAAYDAYRESTGRDLPIPLDALKAGYKAVVNDLDDHIPAVVRKKFEAIVNPPRPHTHGAPAASPPPQQIVDPSGKVLVDLTPKPPQKTLSIDEAEKLIKTINDNYNPMNRPQKLALDRLRESVQKSIIGATETGEGMEAATLGNLARDTARQRFQWRDSSPVIQRALGGDNADTFVQNNIISRAAGFDDVAAAAGTINRNPEAREAVRTAIVQQLRQAAVGKGAVQGQDGRTITGNFSGRALESALKDIGDRKLSLFFSGEEVETLKAMARAGSFETFQPRGSAVNNSKTAAGIGGLLQGLSKYVTPLANKLPAGELLVSRPLDYTTLWTMQRPIENVPLGLLAARQRPPFAQNLLLPGVAAGGTAAGLLAAQ